MVKTLNKSDYTSPAVELIGSENICVICTSPTGATEDFIVDNDFEW